jgi:hypothetical protein
MKTITTYIWLFLLPLAAISQTDDIEINSTTMKGIEFDNYKSYTWLPFIDSIHTNEFDKQTLDKQITAAVDAELQSRGLRNDSVAPQLYIVYVIMLDREQGYVSEPVYGRPNVGVGVGFGRGGYGGMSIGVSSPSVVGTETKKVVFRKGALVVDVIDASTKQSIWRGVANRKKQDDGELVNAQLVINEVVPKMFKKFPIKKSK